MLQVCIDARPLASGHRMRGIGTYVSGLIEHLEGSEQPARSNVVLRYLWDQNPAAAPEWLRLSGRLLVAPTPAQVEQTLRAAGCAVYHATALEGFAPSPTYATVATLYDLIPLRLPQRSRRLRAPREYLAYRRSLRQLARSQQVLAISQATHIDAQALLGIPATRIHVVPLALHGNRARVPSAAELGDAQARLGLELPYFLGVASSDPHKNLLRLLDAFAAFRQRRADHAQYRLYIIGAWMGRPERRIVERIAALGLGDAVRHLVNVPEPLLAPLYAGATALAFPSLMEGFGYPVLEAFHCETPVVTSNCSSLPEVAGDAALYVDPRRTDELTDALCRLADEPELRADLIARGRVRRSQFSWERVARETLAVYQRAAEGRA